MGACIDSGREPLLVMEYLEHGSLYDLLHNRSLKMDGEIVIPMIKDIVAGENEGHPGCAQYPSAGQRSALGYRPLSLTRLLRAFCALSRPAGMNYLHLAKPPILHNDLKARAIHKTRFCASTLVAWLWLWGTCLKCLHRS